MTTPSPTTPVPPSGQVGGGHSRPVGPPSTAPPFGQTANPSRPLRGGPALVAYGAVVVALLSLLLAIYAIAQAGAARRQADLAITANSGQAGGQAGNPQTTARPVPPAAGVERPTAGPAPTPLDVLNPTADFTLVYNAQKLSPQATEGDSAEIDIDEPRVGAIPERTDARLVLSYNATVPHFDFPDGVTAARAPTAGMEPKACADLLRTAPLPTDEMVAAQRGTVLCVATSPEEARALGLKQRIAVISVTALSSTGIVSIEVSAWEIPG